MAKKVTVIQPYLNRKTTQSVRKLRVCAYARVSTDGADQATSYMAQVEYYTEKIEKNPLWEFVGIYADEGISGRKTKGRDEFQEMLQDCEEGLIDLIITKSISRFARNTVECIKIIRYLKGIGVGVFFEKENINTLQETSEFILTIMASIAQAESEDISTNVKWGITKRFQDGTYVISTPAFGYKRDEENNLVIEEEKAKIIRWIYTSYISGVGAYAIAKELNRHRIPAGPNAEEWTDSAVRNILKNPIYEGNMLLQKTYIEPQYPFAKKKNKGELAQYLIEDSHEQIVSHKDAQMAKNVMEHRQRNLCKQDCGENKVYPFTGKIVCAECGKKLKRKKLYVGKPQEKIVWACKTHIKDKEKCKMVEIREEIIQNAFANMWNKLYTNQGAVLEPLLNALNELQTRVAESEEIEKLNIELRELSEQSRILNQVMIQGYMDSALFMEKNNHLLHEIQKCRQKKQKLVKKQKKETEIIKTEMIIELIREEGYQIDFREELFYKTVKKIRISVNHEIEFCLVNGLTLTELEGDHTDVMALANWI